MSTEARMARAKTMGFDTDRVLYHGTNKSFEAFDASKIGSRLPSDFGEGVYLTPDPKFASMFASGDYIGQGVMARGANVMPVLARVRRPYRIDNPKKRGGLPKLQELGIRALGHDGIVVNHANGQVEYVVFNPKNIRSVHAAFVPDERNSSDLLAAAPMAAGGGGLLLASQRNRGMV